MLKNILFSGCTTDYLIHSPPEEHLGCFQVLAVMNKAVINIHLQVVEISFCTLPCLLYIIQGLKQFLIIAFLGNEDK